MRRVKISDIGITVYDPSASYNRTADGIKASRRKRDQSSS
jgi:hypothetical protein